MVHLAGIPTEAPWPDILDVNVTGSQTVLHAAAEAGVRTVVVASSNHAAGFWERPGDGSLLPDDVAPRPDSFYGWSKAAVESLGRLYHERYGLTVVNLRIGWCSRHPYDRRGAEIWLSPDDVGRLVEAALAPTVTGFHTVWGVSANTTSWWSRAGGEAIGYRPQDDSEAYASEFADRRRPPPRWAASSSATRWASRSDGLRRPCVSARTVHVCAPAQLCAHLVRCAQVPDSRAGCNLRVRQQPARAYCGWSRGPSVRRGFSRNSVRLRARIRVRRGWA